MARPTARSVFDDPASEWDFLIHSSDDHFEGQHFDRKEAGRPESATGVSKSALDGIKEHVIKTVSAFANSNVEGGLLVLGLSSKGEVIGTDHLNEDQRNSITNLDTLLRIHAAEIRSFHCRDSAGADKTICLIYSAYVPNAICETPEARPRAWVRSGQQSLLMSQELRDQTRLRKGLFDLDSAAWCPFQPEDLDAEVLREFRRVFHPEVTSSFSDERLLYEAGAIVRSKGEVSFTLPGLLFFASNPQRLLSHAYLRLLKFVVPSQNFNDRGSASFSKDFRGPITKQIRAARTFLRETSFFERLQHRKADGGFSEQPELPPIAVDEAIVNAVAHRDYFTKNPVHCEHYSDAVVVKNPGRMRQPNVDLPDRFSLATTSLDSMPLNRKLLEWLRLMRDPDGIAFVQALSEGTKRMTKEMVALELPPPGVILRENETLVRLESRAAERKAAFLERLHVPTTAFLNLYPVSVTKGDGVATSDEVHAHVRELTRGLQDSLAAHGWFIDKSSFSRVTAHRIGVDLPLPGVVQKFVRFYPAYRLQIHELFARVYLSIDYTCEVLSVLKANEAGRYLSTEDFIGVACVAMTESWRAGRILAFDGERATVRFDDSDDDRQIQANRVIPTLSLRHIETVLQQQPFPFDLHGAIKKHSLASEPAAARRRAEKIKNAVEDIAEEVFPVIFGEFTARLERRPVSLSETEQRTGLTFRVERLSEPPVEFRAQQKLPDVREGITKYGSYDSNQHAIELIPICLSDHRQQMADLIERLKAGKYKYRGAERTFATRFSYPTIETCDSAEGIIRQVDRLLSEHPAWCANTELNRLFLVHTPEAGFASDDELSPYYVVKRRLLEAGIPCQMLDSGTLRNPDWKDLNLSLNITAKCGIAPWVLPESIPDADFFVGLSYTQSRDGRKILGFANVFNSYGKWEFYAGNTATFDFTDRSEHLGNLARTTLERLKGEHSLPSGSTLVFHHSVRIGKEDYRSILAGVRHVVPDASVTFAWVNIHNNFRLFDSRAEADGSVQRGGFVPISKRRVLLSTTGYNTYRKSLGTPRPLEITADNYRHGETNPSPCEARTTALQVLSLTKLNWASTDSFSAEPITTKYAGDIAYLTAAFLRQREPFRLHPALERTPWFI